MPNYRKLKDLNALEWRALFWAVFLLPALRFSLSIWSFQSVLSALDRTSTLPSSDPAFPAHVPPSPVEIASLVRMVNVVANRGPIKARCLPRSLAIWWLLRRRGLDCDLRIGVMPRDVSIQAHAWVEYRGQIVNDEPGIAQDYFAFERISIGQGKQGI